MRIVWTREAAEQLGEIEAYIARDSPERAVRFVDALIDHAEAMLTANPRSGRTVAEMNRPDLRELIFRGYRIVYRLQQGKSEIVTVFEGHRLLRLEDAAGGGNPENP